MDLTVAITEPQQIWTGVRDRIEQFNNIGETCSWPIQTRATESYLIARRICNAPLKTK